MNWVVSEIIVSQADDILGFAASGATLCAFAQKRMMPMRLAAIAANLCFIGYGAMGGVYPVLLLHVVLLPLNVARLFQQAGPEHRAVAPFAPPRRHAPTLMEEWRCNRARLSDAAARFVAEDLRQAGGSRTVRYHPAPRAGATS